MEENSPVVWKKVLATFEEPQHLSHGRWLGDDFPGVALPSTRAWGKWVKLRYGMNSTYAQVMDTGPWCTDDDEYVFGNEQPRAEKYKGQHCPLNLNSSANATLPDGTEVTISNGAGIDLFPRIIHELGLDPGVNPIIEWRFVF